MEYSSFFTVRIVFTCKLSMYSLYTCEIDRDGVASGEMPRLVTRAGEIYYSGVLGSIAAS